jgi:hypothetical protein
MSDLWKQTKSAGIFALALTLSLPSFGQAGVAQMRSVGAPAPLASVIAPGAMSDLVQVDRRKDGRVRDQRGYGRDQRRHGRDQRVDRREGYRGGYRGYRTPRNGYRRDDNDGLFYPLAAFALGAILLNELNNNQRQGQTASRGWSHIPARNISAHDNWCAGKYRSYRTSDKTFQPYNGPRRYCNSPYDAL